MLRSRPFQGSTTSQTAVDVIVPGQGSSPPLNLDCRGELCHLGLSAGHRNDEDKDLLEVEYLLSVDNTIECVCDMGTAWIFSDLCQQWNHTGIFTELATSPWTRSLTCESYPYLYLIVLSPGPNYTTLPLSSPEHQPIYQPIYFGIFLNMDFQVPPRVISMHTKNSAPKFLH